MKTLSPFFQGMIAQIPPYEDIRQPFFLWDSFLIALIFICLGILALIVFGIQRALRKSAERIEQSVPVDPVMEALKQLSQLRQESNSIPAEPFTVRISGIIRRYLEDALSLPAPEWTTEEFLENIARNPSEQENLQPLMKGFLEQCDLVKFARQDLVGTTRKELISQAESIIDHSRPKQPPIQSGKEALVS